MNSKNKIIDEMMINDLIEIRRSNNNDGPM